MAAKTIKVCDVKISDIKIGPRERKEFGDLAELAASIEEHGLLQPIGITPEHELVFGERRLRAYRDVLGWESIPARIVEVRSVLLGQIAENNMRKDYTVSERVAIVESLRAFHHGGDRRSEQILKGEDESLRIDEAAKLAGLGGKDGYYRAKAVVDKGVPELVEAMDKQEMSVSAAAELASLSDEEQRTLLATRKDWTATEIVRFKEDQAQKAGDERHKKGRRDDYNFYPTPRAVTEALLEVEEFGSSVWEPACGDGAISEVLTKHGYKVVSSDIVDRGYGLVENFFESDRTAESIVTNPDYRKMEEFVRTALAKTTRKVAMLLPLTFLESRERYDLICNSPLKCIYVFMSRISLYPHGWQGKKKNGRTVYAWFVWEHGYEGDTRLYPFHPDVCDEAAENEEDPPRPKRPAGHVG